MSRRTAPRSTRNAFNRALMCSFHDRSLPNPSPECRSFQQCGFGMGLFSGAIQESFKNPPQPRPTDKVVLNPPKSDVMAKAMTAMGRQAFMLTAVAAVYSAGEVSFFGSFVAVFIVFFCCSEGFLARPARPVLPIRL